jgi:hypothetical protein
VSFSTGIIPSVEPLILFTKTAPISHNTNNPIKIRICGILRYVSLLTLLLSANFNSIIDLNFLRSLDLKHFLNKITRIDVLMINNRFITIGKPNPNKNPGTKS